ncbi:MAG: Rpn family recombination-promoting nuclease/putative transposase [Candidatus Contendobacter sp.]
MTDHDHGYKRLFSHPEMIRDLLLGFVPADWIAELDFTTLEKYPTEFIDDRLRNRRSDVIWRVRWGRDWLYIYILLEFQSGVHRFMAMRLFTYIDLLYQDLIRSRQLGRPRRLPSVLPVVLYNGRRRWMAPTDLEALIEPGPAGLAAYRPQTRYLLIDESAYADAELASMRNLVAALFRLENSRGPEAVREVLAALVDWLAAPEQEELRHSFLIWLREGFLKARLPSVAFPELNNLEEARIMLTERVVDWTQQWKQEGLQEGLQEGRQEGRQEGLYSERRLLLRQIRRRFGETVAAQSAPALERIEQLAVFEDLGEELFDCADETAWLARLWSVTGEEERH